MDTPTTVVNLRQGPYDVYIGRAGKGQDGYFGNPFNLVNYHNQAERVRNLERYAEYFWNKVNNDPDFKVRLEELRGKRLGCFCKPLQCHGDVIASYLNGEYCPDHGPGCPGTLGGCTP